MIDLPLSDGDKAQPLWKRLTVALETELALLRSQNDDIGKTEQQTAALRGQIKCLKAILRLGDDRPLTGE